MKFRPRRGVWGSSVTASSTELVSLAGHISPLAGLLEPTESVLSMGPLSLWGIFRAVSDTGNSDGHE